MSPTGIDRTLAFLILCLVIIGSVIVFSSSYYQAMKKGVGTTYYFIGHLKRLMVAMVFFFLGLMISYEKFKKMTLPAYVFLVILLVVTLIFGHTQFGARRSLSISSFGIQVSEFVRIWLVFFLANFFSYHPDVAKTQKGISTILLISLSIIFLVAVQPSIAVALISFLTLITMFIYGRIKMKLLLPTIMIGIALFAIFILCFPHARYRWVSFISHPTYQVQQSLIAIGSGGFFGRGPGAGLQKFLFLPRIHNDFIFAHIAEEFGFIGCLLIFVVFWEIFLRGISIARVIEDEFLSLVVYGLNASIFIIFLVHVGVSIGFLPPTGIPLPFVSYGGWSLAANLFAMGVILQASRWRMA